MEISSQACLKRGVRGKVCGLVHDFLEEMHPYFDPILHYDIGLQMKIRILHCIDLNFKLADKSFGFAEAFSKSFREQGITKFLGRGY